MIGSKSEVVEGDFVYRLISGKSTYSQGEKVDLYAELEYVGEGKEIEIAHAASPFYFTITEKTRGFEIIYMMNLPRIVTLLKKGELRCSMIQNLQIALRRMTELAPLAEGSKSNE